MSETTTYQVGAHVRVAAGADDVYFGGEVEGVVIEPNPADTCEQYENEGRVNVRAIDLDYGTPLTQYVRPEDLTLITSDN